jgi:hypothetical protein
MVTKLAQITSHNTTQHKTTNMSRCHPTLQRFCPLSPGVWHLCPQIIMPLLPMGLFQTPSTGFTLAMPGFLVWDNKTTHIKNIEIGGVLAQVPPFYNVIQQPTNSWCLRFYDDREDAQPGQSIWGVAMALFRPSNKQQKNKQSKI